MYLVLKLCQQFKNQKHRDTHVQNITGAIEEYVKENAAMFEMFVELLTAIKDNCVLMNSKGMNSITKLLKEKSLSMPTLPKGKDNPGMIYLVRTIMGRRKEQER